MTDPDPAPVGSRSYRVEARTSAPPEVVWPLVGEARRWREWSSLDRTDLERWGAPSPDGVGAVRRFSSHGVGSREQVVAFEPPERLGYVILSGFPVRNYRADVVLEPDDGGTRIVWSGTYDVKVPGSGPLVDRILHRLMAGFADRLARYADRPG